MAENKVAPYDQTHRLHQLLFVCVVVNEGQEDAICQLLYSNEAYSCYTTRGKGTAPSTFSEVTGTGQLRKAIVFSIIRVDTWPLVKKALEKRFSISRIAKGIAYTIPLTSVMSISVYKMLGNIRFFEKPNNQEKKKQKILGGKGK